MAFARVKVMSICEKEQGQVNEVEQRSSWLYQSFIGPTIHDALFGLLLNKGRKAAIAALPRGEQVRVLEVGSGSGLSFRHYPPGMEVVAIDPSERMLRRAAKRQRKAHADISLVRARGEELPFGREFDAVVLMHVLSVVEDAQVLLEQAHQVLRPGGQIIVVNASHKYNLLTKGLSRLLPQSLVTQILGFHGNFDHEKILNNERWHLKENVRTGASRVLALEKRAA